MRSIWIASACAFLIICFSSTPSSARTTGIALGPRVGLYKTQEAEHLEPLVGAAFRFRFSETFGVETSLSYRQQSFSGGEFTARGWPIEVNGLLYPFRSVYGILGLGWYATTFDFDQPALDDETSRDLGLHIGGGAYLPLSETLRLAGDIRYVFLNHDLNNGSRVDVDSDYYMFSVTLLMEL